MTTEDKKITLLHQELRQNIASRIDKMPDSGYGTDSKGMETVGIVEDEVFKFLGKIIVGAVSNLFKKNN